MSDTPAPSLPLVAPQPASPHRSPWRRWHPTRAWVVAAGLTAAGFLIRPGALLFAATVFIVVVPLERLFPRHRQPLLRPGLGTDIAYLLTKPVLFPLAAVAGLAIGLGSLAWLPGLALRPLVLAIPGGVRGLTGFLLFDMAGYWAHRVSHEVPLLWRFHSIHHSSRQMDWASGIRSHPLDGAVVAVPVAFLLGAGFGARFSVLLGILQVAVALLLHANVRFQWRPLSLVLVSPEFHHWHHSSEPDAINHNYSTFLPVWDLMFGTFFHARGRRPQVYGIAGPAVPPEGLVPQLRYPLRGVRALVLLRHPLRATRSGLGADMRMLRR